MRRNLVICLLLIVATVLAYGRVVGYEFTNFDDPDYVTANQVVQDGLTVDGVVWAWTTGHSANWHPLTWLSHMLDCQLFGLNPAGHHLSSILLHAVNALLVFFVLRALTRLVWPSAFAAALFALHPLHVESVAWVAERKDVLSALFGLLALWAYVAYARGGGRGRYLLVLALLALGLMAKPMLVTLPCVFLLLDFWPLGRLRRRRADGIDPGRALNGVAAEAPRCPQRSLGFLLVEKIPLLGLSAGSSVVTFLVQRSAGAMKNPDSFSLALRCANAAVSYVRYIGKMFWPADLGLIYPHPNMPGGEPWVAGQIVGAALVLALISAVTLGAVRRRYLLVGWLWFLGTLVPVIGLVQVGGQAMADRYTYLPLLGLFIMIAFGAADLVERRPSYRVTAIAAAAAVLVACGAGTWFQAHHWRNWRSLYEHALAVAPNAVIVHYNMGTKLQQDGEQELAKFHLRRAISLNPEHVDARNNLGVALVAEGKIDEAIEHYRKALEVIPDHPGTHCNWGIALAGRGQSAEAAQHYLKALAAAPDFVPAHLNYGTLLFAAGKIDEAIDHYAAALRTSPKHPGALTNMGQALRKKGDLDGAIRYFRQVLAGDPLFPNAHLILAGALVDNGQSEQALDHFRQAVELDPDSVEALHQLAMALDDLGRNQDAADLYLETLRLKPDFHQAHANLGNLLKRVGRTDTAIVHYRQAVALEPSDPTMHYLLGAALTEVHELDEALAQFQEANRLTPDWAPALNGWARILATHPDDNVRDAQQAVRIAERAAKLTEYRHGSVLDALAAAYASAGRFQEAVSTAEKALALASPGTGLAAEIRSRLELYRQDKPYRDIVRKPADAPHP